MAGILIPGIDRPYTVEERLARLERKANEAFEICVGVAVLLCVLFLMLAR